jgi:hypothetical protein
MVVSAMVRILVAPLVPVGLSLVRGAGIRDCIRKAYIGMKRLGI